MDSNLTLPDWIKAGNRVEYLCLLCGWSSALIDSVDEDSVIVVHEGHEFHLDNFSALAQLREIQTRH